MSRSTQFFAVFLLHVAAYPVSGQVLLFTQQNTSSDVDVIFQASATGVVTPYVSIPVDPLTSARGSTGMAFDSSGNFYFNVYQTIEKRSPSGVITPIATLPSSFPYALAVDAASNIYVADSGQDRVDKITPSGTVSIFASLPAGSSPHGLAFDKTGNLYVSNLLTDTISRVTPDGTVSVYATLPTSSDPFGLAFDAAGNLYVADDAAAKVSKISGGSVTTFAKFPLDGARFPVFPYGLCFDDTGNLYVSLQGNQNSISKISPDGQTITPLLTGLVSPRFMVFAPAPKAGDANLDGVVNMDDYLAIDRGYLQHLTGWANGDFSGDGTIDALDYAILDNAYSTQGGSQSAALIQQHTAELGAAYTLALDTLTGAEAVPEPASLLLLGLGAVAVLRRRCRRVAWSCIVRKTMFGEGVVREGILSPTRGRKCIIAQSAGGMVLRTTQDHDRRRSVRLCAHPRYSAC